MKSNLELIKACDNFLQEDGSFALETGPYFKLLVNGVAVGAAPESVFVALDSKLNAIPGSEPPGIWTTSKQERSITLTGANAAERSQSVASLLGEWRDKGTFSVLKGWRNELYPVYGPKGSELFRIERAGASLFGVNTFGVHMTVYVPRTETTPLRIWVARRSSTKSSYPNMLDNAVAGGITAGEKPFASIIREAGEEASLSEDVVLRSIKVVGTATYIYIRDSRAGGETGLLQPECQYLYDLAVSQDQVLQPSDNEVQGFQLLDVDEIQSLLAKDEFKPNCALVTIDFLIRHGIITPENEPDYIEIVSRMHRMLLFPTA